jgi:hypothetical protein
LAEKSLVLYREYAQQMRMICDHRRYLRHTRLSVPLRWPKEDDTRLGHVARNELINTLFEHEERKRWRVNYASFLDFLERSGYSRFVEKIMAEQEA